MQTIASTGFFSIPTRLSSFSAWASPSYVLCFFVVPPPARQCRRRQAKRNNCSIVGSSWRTGPGVEQTGHRTSSLLHILRLHR
eukprot:9390524-Pyramimonas_sp.AAC.1